MKLRHFSILTAGLALLAGTGSMRAADKDTAKPATAAELKNAEAALKQDMPADEDADRQSRGVVLHSGSQCAG
jgi:hypothetical protein